MDASDIKSLVRKISELPDDFHDAGVIAGDVLQAAYEFSTRMEIKHSVETGCGKSTLLFSHLSGHHRVFTLDGVDDEPNLSYAAVLTSPLLNKAAVEFILGPTQATLPAYRFQQPLQLIFLDGPHGFPFPQMEYFFLYPHLEADGLLILDDIHIPTINQLHEFIAEDDMFEHLDTVVSTSFFRRTSSPLFDPLGDGWWQQNYNKARIEEFTRRYYPLPLRTRIYQHLESCFGPRTAEAARNLYLALRGR